MIGTILLTGALFVAVQDAGAPAAAEAADNPDNQRECRLISEIGSRLARRRVCATRAEWAESDRAARANLEGRGRQVAPTYDELVRNANGAGNFTASRPTTRCARC